MPIAWINDRDLRDLGFVIDDFTGFTDGLTMERETVPIPGRYGVMPLGTEPRAAVRDITLIGHLEAAAPAALEAAYAALRAWVSRDLVEIRSGLNPDIVFHGEYLSAPGNPVRPKLLRRWGSLSLTFRCKDPLGYDRYERVIKVLSTPTPIPQGTGPLAGVLRVHGVTTSPLTVTKRDHAGRVTGTLTLGFSGNAFTLGAADRVEINNLTGTIQRFVNSVPEDAIAFLTGASEFPLRIGPDECDREASAWATLEVSGFGAGAGAEWIGARTYL